MMKPHALNRRQLLQSASAAALLSTIAQRVHAQSGGEPLDVARVICGFPAGSTSDVTARSIADRLGKDGYAKAGFVDNKTGAGAQIAVQYVKTQAPDGRTFLQTPMSMLGIYPHTYKKLPYDPVADLTPVSLACTFDFGIAVGSAVPDSVKSVPDLLKWFKRDKSNATFGSPAAGATPHFIGILLGRAGGVELTHAPYRGTLPAIQDVLGGQLPAVLGPVGDLMRFSGSNKYRVLATTGASRSRFAQEVPTLAEQGFDELVFDEWYGIFMPPGASSKVLQRANAAVRAAVESSETVKVFAAAGLEARASTSKELAELLKRDTLRWGPVVRSVGFTVDS